MSASVRDAALSARHSLVQPSTFGTNGTALLTHSNSIVSTNWWTNSSSLQFIESTVETYVVLYNVRRRTDFINNKFCSRISECYGLIAVSYDLVNDSANE